MMSDIIITCPYCGARAKLVKSSEIYNSSKDYGMFWVCSNFPNCDAYVGCHPNTTTPLGRLADYNLRKHKSHAHAYFDPIWREKHMKRPNAYKWLADKMDIPVDMCHIGMLDIEQCRKVVQICREYFEGKDQR